METNRNAIELAQQVKRQNEFRLMRMKNVVAVGIGFKTVGGVQTDEVCVVVSVVNKLPLIQLPEAARVPLRRDILALMRADPLTFLSEELESLKQQGLYRHLRILEGEQGAHATFDHKSVVNLSSNNYLGLTTHPRLREAALDAVKRFGAGSGSVRTIAGTMDLHMELERRLAAFKHVEAVVNELGILFVAD